MFASHATIQTSGIVYDTDAQSWINAVETADTQPLEARVKAAMNQLVLDLKSNSLWTPITSLTIQMGARTIAGTLIDVKTPSSSWSNVNFLAGDYNRTTGLIGNGSTKYLNPGVLNSVMSQNNAAAWVHVHTVSAGNTNYFGSGSNATNGTFGVSVSSSPTTQTQGRAFNDSSFIVHAGANAVGLIGYSRNNSANYISRGGQANLSITRSSATPTGSSLFYFANNIGGSPTLHSDGRIRACCYGQAHNMDTAETIINTYIASITALGL
jgi:hypothetical protein